MADTEIIKVLLQLENPEAFKQLEQLKKGVNVNITSSPDKGLQEILSLAKSGTQIKITADTTSALKSLQDIKTTIQSFQNVSTIKLNLSGDILRDLEKIDRKIGEIQARALLPQLNQLGAIQNNNVKTLDQSAFSPGGALDQAKTLKRIQDEAAKQLNELRINSINPTRAAQERILGTVEKSEGPSTRKRRAIRGGSTDDRDLITIERQRRRNAQDSFEAAEKQKQEVEKLRNEAISKFNQSIAPSSSLADRQKFLNSVSDLSNRKDLLSRGFTQLLPGDLKRFQEEERRKAIESFQEFTPKGTFSSVNRRLKAAKPSPAFIPESDVDRERLGDLIKELGLGALAGSVGGVGKTLFSLAGGGAGAAFGPGGSLLGSAIGGALFESTTKSIEGLASALENVTSAGLEFQKTIVALTGVFQANTNAFDSSGNKLGSAEQVQFSQQRAREIQRAARSELLPLGIGGEAESVIVQGLISGLSQRGILLDAEQTKTVAGRLGAAVLTNTPQLLSSPTILRKDVEDVGAKSSRASSTTLGIALRQPAPDLFRTLTTGDDVVRATERLEQFKIAIQNSDQAAVQLLRLSGAIDKLRTTLGDEFLQALQPAFKGLADTLNNEDLENLLAGVGKTLGQLGSTAIEAALGIGKAIDSIASKIPFLDALRKQLIESGKEAQSKSSSNITTAPKPEEEIGALLRNIGIESTSEVVEKAFQNEPRSRLQQLQNAFSVLTNFQDGDLENRFAPGILLESVKASQEATQADIRRVNQSTFEGKRRANDIIISGADRTIDLASKGQAFALSKLEEANQAGDTKEASRLVGLVNTFADAIQEEVVKREEAVKANVIASLDSTKALQSLRNATEGVVDVQKQQILQSRELARSLASARESLDIFDKKVANAFASQEEQILNAAKEFEAAGGISPFSDIDSRLQEAKKTASGTKLNQLLAESGAGIQVDTGAGGGLNLPRSGTSFAESIEREREALADSIAKTTQELEKLPRALRDAIENLKDLKERTKLQFDEKPPLPSLPGLPPLFGDPTDLPFNFGPTEDVSAEDLERIKESRGIIPLDEFGFPTEGSRSAGEGSIIPSLPAFPALFGGPAGLPEDVFTQGPETKADRYRNKIQSLNLRTNMNIPNSSDIKNISPTRQAIYEDLVGASLDSSIKNNVRPQSSITLQGAATMSVNASENKGANIVDAVKEVGKNIEQSVRRAIESSFGGG